MDRSTNQRLADAGIKTIRLGEKDKHGRDVVYLEYCGKRIRRPSWPEDAPAVCAKEFGIEI